MIYYSSRLSITIFLYLIKIILMLIFAVQLLALTFISFIQILR